MKKTKTKKENSITSLFYTTKNNKIIVPFEYESIDDIFIENGVLEPFLNPIFYQEIDELIDSGIKVKQIMLDIKVHNKNIYDNKRIYDVFKNNFKLKCKVIEDKKRRVNIISLLVMIIGALLLAIAQQNQNDSQILMSEIISISGTLLIWEGLYMATFENFFSTNTLNDYRYLTKRIKIE